MPLYDFECADCEAVSEVFFKMDECPEHTACPECGGPAHKVLVHGHGGVHSDTPNWLDDSVIGALQDDDLVRKGKIKPIETREEYNRHLKEKNIAPVPAFREI